MKLLVQHSTPELEAWLEAHRDPNWKYKKLNTRIKYFKGARLRHYGTGRSIYRKLSR